MLYLFFSRGNWSSFSILTFLVVRKWVRSSSLTAAQMPPDMHRQLGELLLHAYELPQATKQGRILTASPLKISKMPVWKKQKQEEERKRAKPACSHLKRRNLWQKGFFPSFPKPLLQSEAEFIAIDVKMILQSHANKTHFHKKGFAVSFVLKVRVFGTRKWPIRT